jgi:hypothetical protein
MRLEDLQSRRRWRLFVFSLVRVCKQREIFLFCQIFVDFRPDQHNLWHSFSFLAMALQVGVPFFLCGLELRLWLLGRGSRFVGECQLSGVSEEFRCQQERTCEFSFSFSFHENLAVKPGHRRKFVKLPWRVRIEFLPGF